MPESATWVRFASIHSPPVVASGRGTHAHVFALGERRAVRHFRFNKAPPWTVPPTSGNNGMDLGGELTSQPAAYMRGDTVHVFGRGLDNAFWDNRSHDAGAHWTGWRRLGGSWLSGPSVAVASTATGTQIVVVGSGEDSTVWALTSTDSGETFAIKRFAAGAIPGQPIAATDWQERTVVVYASFPDSLKVSTGDTWATTGMRWASDVVPVLASDPVAVANGILENLLGRDVHGRLWMYAYDSTTGRGSGGVASGSQLVGKPAVAIQSYAGFDPLVIVVARAPDSQLYISRLSPGTGGEGVIFSPLHVSASSDPAVVGGEADHVSLVFAREGDQLLYGRVVG